MIIYKRNRKQSYRFIFSVLIFVFSMARVAALMVRVVWASHARNVKLAMVSQIFTAAGVLLLFVINMMFVQRAVRSYHPFFGWSKGAAGLFRGSYGSVVLVLMMVVVATVQAAFVPPPQPGDGGGDDVEEAQKTLRADRVVQLICGIYLTIYAVLPLPLIAIASVAPRAARLDKFGEGHFRTKFTVLFFTATLLSAGAFFRTIIGFFPRPVSDPGWYHSKVCYYCFNYVIELVVVYTYALSRFDQLFYVPNGSVAPGHYSTRQDRDEVNARIIAGEITVDQGLVVYSGPGQPTQSTGLQQGDEQRSTEDENRESIAANGATVDGGKTQEVPAEKTKVTTRIRNFFNLRKLFQWQNDSFIYVEPPDITDIDRRHLKVALVSVSPPSLAHGVLNTLGSLLRVSLAAVR